MKDGRSVSAAEDDMSDVYPLQLRLSVLQDSSSLGVKIMKKVIFIFLVSDVLIFVMVYGTMNHNDCCSSFISSYGRLMCIVTDGST